MEHGGRKENSVGNLLLKKGKFRLIKTLHIFVSMYSALILFHSFHIHSNVSELKRISGMA